MIFGVNLMLYIDTKQYQIQMNIWRKWYDRKLFTAQSHITVAEA